MADQNQKLTISIEDPAAANPPAAATAPLRAAELVRAVTAAHKVSGREFKRPDGTWGSEVTLHFSTDAQAREYLAAVRPLLTYPTGSGVVEEFIQSISSPLTPVG